jgi:hypothetical protein
VPAWHIITPEVQFVILTRFDPDNPKQRERMLALIPRFLAWKLATAFVLTAETWPGPERTRSGEEAVATIGDLLDAALAIEPPAPTETVPNRRRRFHVIKGGKA